MSNIEVAKEKIATANLKKEFGNMAFKEGEIQKACRFYHEAILYASGLDNGHLSSMVY